MDGGCMRMQLPESFVKRVGEQLGSELPSFLDALAAAPVRGLRMNPFRVGVETPFRDALERVPWCETGWTLPPDSRAGVTIAHEAGAFYLQEPGAMIPAAVIRARPGEKILDLCAAPGGKTTQLGADLRGEGLLVCNEPVPKRAAVLSRNAERMGIPNAVVVCARPEQLAERWPEGFDGVMADVPCSGEGMFRRDPETVGEWSPEKAAGCVLRQREILEAAAKLVRPGGRMVYATCTFHPEENENQIRRFLSEHPEFKPEPFRLPGVDGAEGWFTCWPHRSPGEGQFAALLRKMGSGTARLEDGRNDFRISAEERKAPLSAEAGLPEANARFGQTLVLAPEIPVLKGIRVLRLGLHLGEKRGSVFFPDHAAAMSPAAGEAPAVELTEAEALKYLSGETLEGTRKGWCLMKYQGLPLGWGKGSGGQIKNHYPKGLRNSLLIG